MRADRLRRLEALVLDAARQVQRLQNQNEKLRVSAQRALQEKARVELEMRKLKALSRRQEHTRQRIQRALRAVDKIMDITGVNS